jgi:hypothetical protein
MPHASYAKVDKGVNVAKVQAMLAELCYEPGIVDGAWGKKTETAVKAFFAKHYRKYDGSFDVNDANFILSAGASAKAFGSASVKKCLVVYSDRIGNSLNNDKIKQITQKVAHKKKNPQKFKSFTSKSSTKSLKSSCPNGSEPKKTLSANGNFFTYKCSASSSSGINTYGGSGYISEDESPNFETMRWSLYRKIHYRPLQGETFHSVDGKNSYKFEKNLRKDSTITKQINSTPLLSYLLYENGKITIDEISPSNRFGDIYSDTTMFHSMSMGKSITSLLVGHAICEGQIESIDAVLDWDILKNTLYHNQKLINFLNMATGDKYYSDNDESNVSIQRRMNTEFRGSKRSSPNYNYTNLNTNIVISYLNFKYGDEGFKNFLDNIFQNLVKIEHTIFLKKTPDTKKNELSLGHQFFATRYDYLRIAKSMLDAWQNNTCLGKYLKEIHTRRIPKNGAQGTAGRNGLPRSYAGFFHTGYKGMENRPVLGMDGNGGQTILIDFARSRIVATLSVFDNNKYPRQGSFDYKTIVYKKIKNGKKSPETRNKNSSSKISAEQLVSENNKRRRAQKEQKQYWDKYYHKVFFGSITTGSVLLRENFEKPENLKVISHDKDWKIENEYGNAIYCNKVRNRWTNFNFGVQNWSNYAVSFRMKFLTKIDGKVETHIRKINQKDYRTIITQSRNKTAVSLLNKSLYAKVPSTEWMDVKFSANKSDIRLLINNEPIIITNDDTYSQGGGMIAVSANSKVCVDDIVVRKI